MPVATPSSIVLLQVSIEEIKESWEDFAQARCGPLLGHPCRHRPQAFPMPANGPNSISDPNHPQVIKDETIVNTEKANQVAVHRLAELPGGMEP